MDESFWEEVERARRLTPEQRLQATLSLSDLSRQLMRDGIRHQFPEADESQVQLILLERYRIARDLERDS